MGVNGQRAADGVSSGPEVPHCVIASKLGPNSSNTLRGAAGWRSGGIRTEDTLVTIGASSSAPERP